MRERWFASLLSRPLGATQYIRAHFPSAHFYIEKRFVKNKKMYRWIRFDLNNKTILRARAVVDLDKSHPTVAKKLESTTLPIGEIVKEYHAHRTRLKTTSRSRSFHFVGDIHARIHERFFHLPPSAK